ncbi:MATE family efflux transporter [Oscillospiraceae bacterium LTW-04]|nr:MATE family efflux transporter [Oscillospiraceae bacterium MB24-C1]
MFSNKDITRLMIPLIIEQALAVTIGVADTVMVAYVGETVVSGVSIVDAINMLLVQVFAALATGGAIVVAQYLGRQNKSAACEAAKQLFLVMGAIGITVAAICVTWRYDILRLVYNTVEPAVLESAQEYFYLTALSFPFFAIYNSGAALFRSQGNSRISMLTALMMNVLNIGGNAIFLFGYHMGARAVGLATLISRIVGAIVMVYLIRDSRNRVYVERMFPLNFRPRMVGTILRIGVPTGLENGMFHFGKLMVSGLIASFGTVAITANAVGNSITSIACIPGSAVGLGMITVVGQCIGAGEYEQARYYIKKLLKLAYIVGGATNILALLFMKQLVGVFLLSPQTAQLAIIISSMHAGAWLIFWPTAFTLPNGLRAAGDVKFTMIVSVSVMWACRIGLSYVFALYYNMGVVGVWLAMIFDWVVRTVFYITRFIGTKWHSHTVI